LGRPPRCRSTIPGDRARLRVMLPNSQALCSAQGLTRETPPDNVFVQVLVS
jgi:hypothetical protein